MTRLAELLAQRALATLAKPEPDAGPMKNYKLEHLEAGVNVRYHDQTPDERAKAKDARKHRRARRVAAANRQTAEYIGVDEDTEDQVDFDRERFLTAASSLERWYPTLRKISTAQLKRLQRFLGRSAAFTAGDVAQELHMRLARQIAREPELSLRKIALAVTWLNEHSAGIPTDVPSSQPEAQWLVRRAKLYARWTIRDLYRHNPTPLSLEALDTAFANTGGVDSLISSVKADHAPSMSGFRFADPGKVDPLALAALIDTEIERRDLGEIADLLLSEETLSDGRLKYRRNDGAFRWSTYGGKILEVLHHEPMRSDASSGALRMRAIRATRAAFEWLEAFIPQAIHACLEGQMPHERRFWAVVIQFPDPEAMAKAVDDNKITELISND